MPAERLISGWGEKGRLRTMFTKNFKDQSLLFLIQTHCAFLHVRKLLKYSLTRLQAKIIISTLKRFYLQFDLIFSFYVIFQCICVEKTLVQVKCKESGTRGVEGSQNELNDKCKLLIK